MGTAIISKLILLVFCLREKSQNAKLLALDQRNDVITNVVVLSCAFIGDRVWVYADPIGAILISMIVAMLWFHVAWTQIPIMSGKRASIQHINRIITICYEHQPSIQYLDKVLVYHYTDKLLVDVCIVLPSKTYLEDACYIMKTLQTNLEQLPYVERAFVRPKCLIAKEDDKKPNIVSDINQNIDI